MKYGTKRLSTRFVALIAILCLAMACFGLAACGGGSSSSAASASSAASSGASSSAAASSSASASASSAATTTDKFVGTWKVAALQSQGVTMGGNLGEVTGVDEDTDLVINADGTGSMTFSGDKVDIAWTENKEGISIKPSNAENAELAGEITATYEDGALFVTMAMDGQEGMLIYTQDGTYAGVKQISMEGAKAITSESELLGTWKLAGLNMMGVSMYGDSESLSAAMSSMDPYLKFDKDGIATWSGMSCTWKVDASGSTLTYEGLNGQATSPILMSDDGIVIDASGIMSGLELIELFEK